jgi:hypothetical protein
MEFARNPESRAAFKSDFAQAIQLFGEVYQIPLSQVDREQYVRLFGIALLAADIAEGHLNYPGLRKQVTAEDLGLSFEDNEPITLVTIFEKSIKTQGCPDFSFVNLILGGKSVSSDQPEYVSHLRNRHSATSRISGNIYKPFETREDLLHRLLENDQ